MRLFIRLLLVFAVLFFVLFKNGYFFDSHVQAVGKAANKIKVTNLADSYQDQVNGYSIKPLGDLWVLTPSPGSKNLIKLDISHQSGKCGLQVRVYKGGWQSFDEFVKNYIKHFKSDMKNPEILTQKPFNGQNITGVVVAFDGRQRNGYLLKSYIFPGKDAFYVLQGGCPFAQKNELEPELDKIAASFSLH